MENKTVKIVISRYNEDISWIERLSPLFTDIVIYNKGNDISSERGSIINIPNLGREGQTYAQFIIDNYDNLPDYVLFCQARPEDRGWNKDINGYISEINQIVSEKPRLHPLGWINVESLDIMPPIEEHRFHEMKYKDEYEKMFKMEYPRNLKYSSGATLWVPKENILGRSKNFYVSVNEMLNKDVHPPLGWIIERFWLTIFSPEVPSWL